MKEKLTARTIKTFTPTLKPYKVWDTEIPGFHLRIQPTGTMTYRFEYRNQEGVKRDYRIGKAALKPMQARGIAENLHAKVRGGVDVVEEQRSAKQRADVRKTRTLRTYLENVYTPAVSTQRTATKKVNRILSKFANYLDTELAELTQSKLQAWVNSERAKGNSEWTIKRDLSDLKALLNHAHKHGQITVNPISRWTPENTVDNSRVRFLGQHDPEERKRFLEALDRREANIRAKRESHNTWLRKRGREVRTASNNAFADHLKPIVLVSLNTGLRRRELFELEWKNVDFERNLITVTSQSAKSKRARHIKMIPLVRKTLKAWQDQTQVHGLVFPGKGGRPLDNVKSAWSTLLNMAEVRDFTWHDMRHDFASRLVMSGVDIYQVRLLLGHSSITQTERYAHLAEGHLEDAMDRLSVSDQNI